MGARLIVAGDLCAAGTVEAALSGAHAEAMWGEIGALNRVADFSIVNVECPLTDNPVPIVKSGPHLWASAKSACGIRAGGFTAACLANNHILDAGAGALVETIRACREAGLKCVGAGENYASATAPLYTNVNEMRLGVLAFAENEFSTTTGPQPGAWPFDLIDNSRQIVEARRASDYVLVLLHGGAESYSLPSPRLQKACRFFVDQGADAVVCHHSHVVAGTESYRGRPIVYGTGNLLFDSFGPQPEGWSTGCIVALRIDRHETLDLQLVPYHQYPDVPSIELIMGSERDSFLSWIECLNGIVTNPEQLHSHWGAFCRQRRPFVLGSMLCLTKPEYWLLARRLLPTSRLRVSRRRLARALNLFSCETHSETCEQALRDMLIDERA